MEGKTFLDVVLKLVQIAFVELRNEDGLDHVALGGKDFFLEAADGHDLSQKGQFACHCHVWRHDLAGNQRVDCSGHCDSGRRAVLRGCSLGDVQVDAVSVEPCHVYAVGGADALDVGVGYVGAFLHDLTELACDLQLAAAGDALGLDGKDITAHGSPCKTYRHSDFVCADDFVFMEDGLAKVFDQKLVGDAHRAFHKLSGCLKIGFGCAGLKKRGALVFVLDYLHCDLAVDLVQAFLKVTDTGLAGIFLCDLVKHLVGVTDIGALEAMLCTALGYEVLLSDVKLLLRCVAGKLDDFHSVQKRARNGVGCVCGDYEQHVGHIEREIEVMVSEGGVLLGIEHFQKGGCRVSLG